MRQFGRFRRIADQKDDAVFPLRFGKRTQNASHRPKRTRQIVLQPLDLLGSLINARCIKNPAFPLTVLRFPAVNFDPVKRNMRRIVAFPVRIVKIVLIPQMQIIADSDSRKERTKTRKRSKPIIFLLLTFIFRYLRPRFFYGKTRPLT